MQEHAHPDYTLAPIAALMLLCLIWAWASLRADLMPRSAANMSLTPLIMQALLLTIFAVLSAAPALIRKGPWPRGSLLALNVVVGLGLFAIPALLHELGNGWIDDPTRVALFSLTPLFAVVLEPHIAKTSTAEARGGLAAALIAVSGTLLVFPVEIPHSTAAALAFCGVLVSIISAAAANCLAVRVLSEEARTSGFSFAAIAAVSAALCLGAIGRFLGHHDSPVPLDAWTALDLVALALLFWLMKRMSAVRMTTRFLIAPLLANVIGLAFLRPHVQLQSWMGLVLIALGAGWLLFAPQGAPAATGSPLGIR